MNAEQCLAYARKLRGNLKYFPNTKETLAAVGQLFTEYESSEEAETLFLRLSATNEWPGLGRLQVIARQDPEPEPAGFHLIQIRRLKLLRRYPEPESERELAEILRRHSKSDAHAKQIIDELIIDTSYCPTPQEIVAVAQATAPDDPPRPNCAVCAGTGWRHVVIHGYSAVQPCLCQTPKMQPSAANSISTPTRKTKP